MAKKKWLFVSKNEDEDEYDDNDYDNDDDHDQDTKMTTACKGHVKKKFTRRVFSRNHTL